jgi:hypothetical protein
MKRKLLYLLAVSAIISSTTCPVMAAEPLALPNDGIVQPRWSYVDSVSVIFDRDGNIETSVWINGEFQYVVVAELRESNGILVDSWEEENGDVYTSYDLESGKRYYIRATVKVYNSSGRVIETATKSSSIITAR